MLMVDLLAAVLAFIVDTLMLCITFVVGLFSERFGDQLRRSALERKRRRQESDRKDKPRE